MNTVPLRRLVAGLVLLLAWTLATAAPAWAHAQLVGTDPTEGAVLPTAPSSVTLTFSEPVRLTGRPITTYDAAGDPVESTARVAGDDVVVRLDEPLGTGTYLVSWLVVSDDGHPISGTLTFSVGERSPVVTPPPPLPSGSAMTADRGLLAGAHHLGLLLAGGLALFLALLHPVAGRATRRWIRGAAGLAVLATWAQVPVASAYAQGLGWAGVVDGFDAGLVGWEIGAACLVTAGAAALWLATRGDAPPVRLGRGRRAVLLLGSVVALSAPALVGHSRAYGPGWLVQPADGVHVLVAAVWLGGIVGLWLVLREGDRDATARALGRFSTAATWSLVLLGGTGVFLGWRILGSWSGLVTTTYGVLLLAKVGLVLVVAGLAAWNRAVVVPRVMRGESPGPRLGRTLLAEAVLLAVVAGVAGFLANQPPVDAPEPPAPPRPVAETVELGELRVAVALTPGAPGGNTLALRVQDADGRPVETPEDPTVELRSEEFDLGSLALRDLGGGVYEALVPIPRGGDWRLSVGLRTSRFDNPVATLEVPIPERSASGQ